MNKENTSLNILFICIIAFCFNFVLTQSAPQEALVTNLPGCTETFPSKHYAGYVTIDENHGKKLYYYFVVSERNPSKDPVVLWLNGGPGASSFDGFIYEHGPFNFEKGKTRDSMPTLHLNPYSWSKVSNIIYLDSPAGVGFSYSDNTSDYITGDKKTASDSHLFLLKWFELFPEFQSNPFYLSGESYAGIYVPTLAQKVVEGIDAGVKPSLNFKGYLIGNGVTDTEIDGNAFVPFAHGMGLIPDDLYQEVVAECHGNYHNPTGENCENKMGKVNEALSALNVYNILEPCYHGTNPIEMKDATPELPQSFRRLGETKRPMAVRKRMFGRAWPLGAPVRDGIIPTWSQLRNSEHSFNCTDNEVGNTWLNNAAVRKAIHAADESVSGPWYLNTDKITFTHDTGSMIEYHRNLTSLGYRALIYSGDHDMCIPFTGSERWTRSMGYDIVDEWRPWIVNRQVAGYIQGYANDLTFLTIKGSGHTVPEYKPREALEFYTRWLEGRRI